MAEEGLVPFASTYAVFATRRAYDFICLDIAEEGLNVKIVCALPGLTTGYGPSHQATEDLAILRGLPGLTIVDPCDALDIEQAVPQLAAHDGPIYLRLLRGNVPLVLDEYDYRFELGKAAELRTGRDVVIISTGLHDHARAGGRGAPGSRPRRRRRAARARRSSRWTATRSCAPPRPAGSSSPARTTPWSAGSARPSPRTLAFAGAGTRVVPIALPDEFLAAGALPTLHDRYGLSTDAVIARIKSEL